jgi:hypothetical protein
VSVKGRCAEDWRDMVAGERRGMVSLDGGENSIPKADS